MGAQTTYRYRRRGTTSDQFSDDVGTVPTIVGWLVPPAFQDVTYDADFHTTAVEVMAIAGWDYAETSPPASTLVTLANVQAAKLTSNTASIAVAAGWTDVVGSGGGALSKSISTFGASVLGVVVSGILQSVTLSLDAQVRALINGGAFSDALVGEGNFNNVAGGFGGFTTFVDIPSTGSRTTYTVRIQARTTTALSSITLRQLSSSLSLFEYMS